MVHGNEEGTSHHTAIKLVDLEFEWITRPSDNSIFVIQTPDCKPGSTCDRCVKSTHNRLPTIDRCIQGGTSDFEDRMHCITLIGLVDFPRWRRGECRGTDWCYFTTMTMHEIPAESQSQIRIIFLIKAFNSTLRYRLQPSPSGTWNRLPVVRCATNVSCAICLSQHISD